jgi:hypothetical protein
MHKRVPLPPSFLSAMAPFAPDYAPTEAELSAHVALARLATTWSKRNTAERVTTALSNGLQGEQREPFTKS